ncbi:MAG: hypothetical protein HZC40_20560 [Chloroflexi bacterium]|nr:hypothetical protein [Chloroflexota bacterium]
MKSDFESRLIWSREPTRTAWLVLWGALVVLLLLCALVPYGTYSYLLHATTAKSASLEVISGTMRVREPGSAAPIAVTRALQLAEGSAVETDENSRGIITLLDGSTLILFPGTQLTLRELRVPTFGWGIEPIRLEVDHSRGRIRAAAGHSLLSGEANARERIFRVRTAHAIATLAEGSHGESGTRSAHRHSQRRAASAAVACRTRYYHQRRFQRSAVARLE